MSKLPAETEELKILDKDEEMQDDGNYSNDEPENNINNTSSNFLENYFNPTATQFKTLYDNPTVNVAENKSDQRFIYIAMPASPGKPSIIPDTSVATLIIIRSRG